MDDGLGRQLIDEASDGHLGTVRRLLAAGADVNRVDADGRTALIEAAFRGHLGVVDALFTAGAEIDRVDNQGLTALAYALMGGNRDIVIYLRMAGADAGYIAAVIDLEVLTLPLPAA